MLDKVRRDLTFECDCGLRLKIDNAGEEEYNSPIVCRRCGRRFKVTEIRQRDNTYPFPLVLVSSESSDEE